MKRLIPFSYYEIIEACARPGCPVCRLSEKSVNKYLDALMYEQVNDPGTRDTLRRSLGFCNEHAWRLPDTGGGAALGVAIIYRELVGRISHELGAARYARGTRFTFRQVQEILERDMPGAATENAVRSLQPLAECPACAHRDRMETIALIAMLDELVEDERMRAALKSSSGLCLPHLRRAFQLAREEATFVVLLAIIQEKVAGLQVELGEFIRKNDYRFNQQGFGVEADSWRRAIAWMVGAKGVR